MNSLSTVSGNNPPLILGKVNDETPQLPLFRSPTPIPSQILAKMDFFKIFPEEELRCPRSKQIFKNPMILPCGDSFDQECLDEWEKNNLKICPNCSKPYDKKMEYIFLKTILQRINEKISFAQSKEPSVDDLFKELPEVPEKAQVKLGIDQYRLGNTAEGAKLFIPALLTVQDFVLSKQLAMILNKLNTSIFIPEKKTEITSTPVNNDERPSLEPTPTGENINNQPPPPEAESRKRPLEREEEKPAKRPKMMLKMPKPPQQPLPGAQNISTLPVDALLLDEDSSSEEDVMDTQPSEDSSLLDKMKQKITGTQITSEINEDNANSCDENGNTPLHLVAEYYLRTSEITKKLFDFKANIHQKNYNGDTPLHSAARHNKIALITDLRNRGANVKIANNQDKLPKDLATSTKAIQLLSQEWDYQT